MKFLFIAMLLSVSSLSFAAQVMTQDGAGIICSSDLNVGQTETSTSTTEPKLPGALGGG